MCELLTPVTEHTYPATERSFSFSADNLAILSRSSDASSNPSGRPFRISPENAFCAWYSSHSVYERTLLPQRQKTPTLTHLEDLRRFLEADCLQERPYKLFGSFRPLLRVHRNNDRGFALQSRKRSVKIFFQFVLFLFIHFHLFILEIVLIAHCTQQ